MQSRWASVCVGFVWLSASAAVGAPASQPASELSAAQQKALGDLLTNLETLQASPESLPRLQGQLAQERARVQGELSAVRSRVSTLREQLAAAEREEKALALRLGAVEVGASLLAGRSSNPMGPAAVAATPATQPASVVVSAAKPAVPADAGTRLFVEQVRPVLAGSCLNCHGGQFKKGGFDLSTREKLVQGGDSGAAVVPGKATESLLYRLVTHAQDPHMPAKAAKLPDATIARIAEWINAGAPYDGPLTASQATGTTSQPAQVAAPKHWAFQPVKRPVAPEVKNATWVRNPIDAFVLAKLEASGMTPSPEADRRTLIRRLSLHVLGLLPKPEEVEAFVNDTQPDAYERLVDRLLASPHYGERWGRHWLDLARYADSDGYEKDTERPGAWRYRDWVISALNRDVPFDQFTIEQLAGDLLPNATLEQRVATGFHRNTLTNKEGGVDQEEYRVKAVVDRTNTTGAVWLGLTVGCAQCHSHKYDPISNREYYQLYAFFNSSQEVDEPAPLPGNVTAYQQAREAFQKKQNELSAALAAYEQDRLPARQGEWEQRVLTEKAPEYRTLKPLLASSQNGTTLTVGAEGVVVAGGKNPDVDTFVIVAPVDLDPLTAIRIEPLADTSLPAKGPGRSGNGNFVLSEVSATVTPLDAPGASYALKLQNAQADHVQKDADWKAGNVIDGKGNSGWAILPEAGKDHALLLEVAPHGLKGRALLTLRMDFNFGGQHTIGKMRVSSTVAPRPVRLIGTPANIRDLVKVAPTQRSAAQKADLLKYFRTIDSERLALQKQIDAHAKTAPTAPMAQMLVENPKPPAAHILIKGDFLRPGDEVSPQTLSILPALHARGAKPDRLDLARWIVDPANPMTPRVAMNRMWKHLLGQAFVTTVEDFGTRSDPPTHPELLDWLASEFVARGWSQKAMIKLIVTSATYRQSSHVTPELIERDPKNALLARQSRYRVEAEVVRDILLQAGGLLNEKIGGPSIKPPLPPDIAALTYASSLQWKESAGDEKFRRGLYIHFQRTIPFPMLMTFDEPDSNVTCTRRERSNTPLQSLTLLNDVEFFQCAQSLGAKAMKQSSQPQQARADQSPAARLVADVAPATSRPASVAKLTAADTAAALAPGIRMIYQVCLSREPDAVEVDRLSQLWTEIATLAARDASAAGKMAGLSDTKLAADQAAGAAAWVAVARAVMNLDEFVTLE